MGTKEFSNRLHDAVENYYIYNPDTLMPLLLLALAAQNNLKITQTEQEQEGAYLACSLSTDEIKDYDWVSQNDELSGKIQSLIDSGVKYLNVEMDLGRSLYPIYQTFLHNDTKDVVQEHHHRIGRLVQHSSNAASDKAHRQYATFILAETLLNAPKDYLRKNYIHIFNHIIVKSNLQPERRRLKVAIALSTLLDYYGDGLVYNPFAGCPFAGAMLGSTNNYYGDGDTNNKLYAAGLLLNYGLGISNEHFMQRDSKQWLNGKKIDFVISTYLGFIDGNSAFDFCLGKCLNDEQFTGKYAGMVMPREIFDKMTKNFKEALRRDWIDTIALLPFGEVAVLVDANKQENKDHIRLINCNTPLARHVPIGEVLQDEKYATIIDTRKAKRDGYLKSYFAPTIRERKGYTKVRLGDIVKPMIRKVYDLDKFNDDERVLAYIDRGQTWYGNRWDENIERRKISNLFGPAYLLDEDCLIVNHAGFAEPRLFNSYKGSAFFEDGFAFSLNGVEDPIWLAKELKESYVQRQLHPYGDNEMVPEPLAEEQYLDLILYKESEENEESEIGGEYPTANRPTGTPVPPLEPDGLDIDFVLTDGNKKYKILNYIAHGSFGYTYRAEMLNCTTGEKEIVAIKEYFPTGVMFCRRENNRVVIKDGDLAQFNSYKEMFRSEPDFIMSMNDTPNNHVTEIKSVFEYEPTGTIYYVMKYYDGESLKDMILSDMVPESEQLIMDKIVVPMCKALKTMHSHNILHLDIKPENIVIDENGEAVLIDFGVAQLYSEDGKLLSKRDTHSCSPFSAPENSDGNMRYFAPQADIFGLAATLFCMATNMRPHPIHDGESKHHILTSMDTSPQMKYAVAEGLSFFANDRPTTAQAFLNLFPGCEDIKL